MASFDATTFRIRAYENVKIPLTLLHRTMEIKVFAIRSVVGGELKSHSAQYAAGRTCSNIRTSLCFASVSAASSSAR